MEITQKKSILISTFFIMIEHLFDDIFDVFCFIFYENARKKDKIISLSN